MELKIEKTWDKVLKGIFDEPYFAQLSATVEDAYFGQQKIYPEKDDVFRAFELCPYDKVKVVILGQDPYHGHGQAHGLCFSVQDGVRVPPSLRNIYKELFADLGTPVPSSGNLECWAQQGVLLLNATLTVQGGKPGSHQGLGWERFTDTVIQKLSEEKGHLVFILWGKYAQSKGSMIDQSKHLVLTAPHPSPLSAYHGFFGSKPFSKTNTYLVTHGEQPIQW